ERRAGGDAGTDAHAVDPGRVELGVVAGEGPSLGGDAVATRRSGDVRAVAVAVDRVRVRLRGVDGGVVGAGVVAVADEVVAAGDLGPGAGRQRGVPPVGGLVDRLEGVGGARPAEHRVGVVDAGVDDADPDAGTDVLALAPGPQRAG